MEAVPQLALLERWEWTDSKGAKIANILATNIISIH
jgi:hypothetical protein